MSLIETLAQLRAHEPERFIRKDAPRKRVDITHIEKFMVIAADHPARGALSVGTRAMAMANREDFLQRCLIALSRPGVNGFLGTPDVIEDLTALGALDDKAVWGSMNRAGLSGASFEMDDRFSAYDAPSIASAGLNGGKMLLRINYDDPACASLLESAGHAISALAEHGLNAMVEPFICRWTDELLTTCVPRPS